MQCEVSAFEEGSDVIQYRLYHMIYIRPIDIISEYANIVFS